MYILNGINNLKLVNIYKNAIVRMENDDLSNSGTLKCFN